MQIEPLEWPGVVKVAVSADRSHQRHPIPSDASGDASGVPARVYRIAFPAVDITYEVDQVLRRRRRAKYEVFLGGRRLEGNISAGYELSEPNAALYSLVSQRSSVSDVWLCGQDLQDAVIGSRRLAKAALRKQRVTLTV